MNGQRTGRSDVRPNVVRLPHAVLIAASVAVSVITPVIAACLLGVMTLYTTAQPVFAQVGTTVLAIPELSPSNTEAEAIFKLASRLEAGDATVARDDVLARRLYRIAADSGHAGAQCNLGAMLMDGTGGPTDLAGGAALFRKAALRGHGLAQYNLGVMHALGDGVIKDSGEAMAWIEQAITRLPEGEAMTSAKAWREHLRNRMSSREGMIARNRSQELGDAIVRELAAASTGSASRAARSAVRSGLDELGLSAEALQRLGLAPSGAALAANTGVAGGSGLGGSTPALAGVLKSASVAGSATTAGTTGAGTGAARGTNKASSQAAIAAAALIAPATAPTITASTIPPTKGDSTTPTVPVETALQEWLRAWSERRADDYLNFYDPRYAPLGGVDRAVWAKQRRAAIRHPNWVKVRAEQISTTEMSPEEVVVGFVQVYSASTGHRETTRKSMIWRWTEGHWRIVSEQAATMSAKADREEPAQPIESKPPIETKQPSEPKLAVEPKLQSEPKLSPRGQREGDAAQSKAQRELEAAQAALAKAQREADAAQAKANQEAEALQARAKRDAELAQAKAQREAQAAQIKAQLEAEAAQLKAQRDAESAQLKAQRDAELAAARVKREAELAAARAKRDAELANVRAELEAKQAAAKAAREAQVSAEKAAREAEIAANQAQREAEAAAANARKEEKRLARTAVSALPVTPPVSPSAAAPVVPVAPVIPSAPPAPSAAAAPAVSAPAPVIASTTSTASTTTAPNAAAFEPMVRAWVKAWGDRQVDAYLAFYAPSFEVPGGQDRATWAGERRESMTRPAWIKVRADHLKTSVNGDSAEARFFQVYVVAPGTVELLNKTMRWVWADERWQIVQEQSEPAVRKHSQK